MVGKALVFEALLVVLVLVCLVLASLVARERSRDPAARNFGHSGGAARGPPARFARKSPHLVVDTLNLAHWIRGPNSEPARLTPALIVEAIDKTAPALLRQHPGRVMYVLKDRDSQFNDEDAREAYKRAAIRNKVYVCAAERYVDPPRGVAASSAHSAQGRDDFYMALLAWKWRCLVATEDRLRDFPQLRATIQPFHVFEWAFWRDYPVRDFIRPEASAYARVRRPRAVRFEELGLSRRGVNPFPPEASGACHPRGPRAIGHGQRSSIARLDGKPPN